MEPNNKKNIIIGVGVGVAVVILAWWLIFGFGGGQPATGPAGVGGAQPKGEDVFRPDNEKALGTVEGGTREVIQTEIATPGQGAANVPENVAVPTTVVETGPAAFRHFDISANNNKYSPDTIVVNEGDVIDLSFTAVDDNYDIYFPDFGIYKAVNEGASGKLQFQGNPYGEYRFYCKTACGSSNVEGKLVVNKK